MKNIEEWHKIRNELTEYFGICTCQRKLKTIVDALYSIYVNIENQNFDFDGAEWLLIALLDKNTEAITHGINCEYPILNKEDFLWNWVLETHGNPALEDN